MKTETRNSKLETDTGLAIATTTLAGALYLRTLAPTVLEGDSGEFQFVLPLAGVPHPTGYPLFVMLGWLWLHQPLASVWSEPATQVNAFVALWGALACGVIYLLCRRVQTLSGITLSPWVARLSAFVATGLFAVGPTFWSQAVAAEVYTFHIFLLSALLLTLLAASPEHPKSYLLPSLLLGLALAHHRTTVLLIPALLVYVLLTHPRIFLNRRILLAGLTLILLPQLLYLWIPLRAPQMPYLFQTLAPGQTIAAYNNTLPGFVDYLLGKAFASDVQGLGHAVATLPLAWTLLRGEFGIPVLAIALVGIGMLLSVVGSRQLAVGSVLPSSFIPHPSSLILLALTLLAYLAIVTFGLIYAIGDVFVQFLPSYLIVALWVSLGLAWLLQQVVRNLRRFSALRMRWPLLRLAVALAVLTCASQPLQAHLGGADQSENVQTRALWEQTLRDDLPQNAVLVSNDRDEIMPVWYFQYALNQRRDLTALFPLLTTEPRFADVGSTTDVALHSGRAVYLNKPMPGLEVKYDLQPAGRQGQIVHVVGTAPTQGELAVHEVIGDALQLASVSVKGHIADPQPLHIDLFWQVSQRISVNYSSYVHLLDAQGKKVAQSDDHIPGGIFYPSSLWKPGETLRDTHLIAPPAPKPDCPCSLEIGVYLLPDFQRVGDPIRIPMRDEG